MPLSKLEDILAALPAADSRNLFFTGKFLSPRDLEDEQLYFRVRRQLHNRLVQGTGIVAGFEVEQDRHCPDVVVVQPGFAIDGLGRELILREPRCVRVPLGTKGSNGETDVTALAGDAILVARYEESKDESVPILVPLADEELPQTTFNRAVEGVAFELAHPAQIPEWLWADAALRCGQSGAANQASALSVPLAHLKPVGAAGDDQDRSAHDRHFEIHVLGRKELFPKLTSITSINWPHAGVLSPDALLTGLEIEFGRPLLPDSVPSQVWRIGFEDEQGLRYTLRPRPHSSPQDPARPNAIRFEPDAVQLKLLGGLLSGLDLRITIHCEFLLDLRGQPVDGTFLGGVLPTGNGTPGGTFHSWFRLE